MRPRIVAGLVLVVVAGGVGAALADDGDDGSAVPGVAVTARQPDRPRASGAAPVVVVVRSASGVPVSWERRVAAVPGVERVIRVGRGQALLRASRAGYAIPIDTLVGNARAYASMLPPEARPGVAGLHTGEAVLSRTAAGLRGVGPGGVVKLAGGAALRVGAVLDDGLLNGAEMLVRARGGPPVQVRNALVLARLASPADQRAVERAFAGDRVQVLRLGQPFGTSAGPIVQPEQLKVRFGEVAVRLPFGPDWVRLDPAWVRRNIVARTVPILGSVTCNRRLIPRLRAAFGDLVRRGLSRVVDAGDFAGCYAPRRIPSTGALSLHALGMAIDLNASRNRYNGASHQDPRLVAVMDRNGFTWGGRWPTATDPMHFEYQGGR